MSAVFKPEMSESLVKFLIFDSTSNLFIQYMEAFGRPAITL